jgi:hypothetical protein
MKTFTLTLENLSSGTQRVTSRVQGRTAKYVDAVKVTADQCFDVLRAAAGGYEISRNVFSMEYIDINDEAKKVMGL